MSKDFVLIEEGEKKIQIGYDGDRLEFLITRNGYQWTGFEVDKQMLIMMRNAITKYLGKNLVIAAESKFPEESRHKTALRYINKTTISSEEEI